MDMSAIEDQLQQLALKLDEPFSSSGDPDEVCMALGRRGRELHRGYIRCARGGYLIASRTLLRPALEANILLRFVRQHPEQRSRLWATEPVRLSIKIDEVVREHRLVEQGVTSLVLPNEDELLEMHREVARARKAANDAGIPGVSRNGPLVPNLREQVELIDTPETWQAYATAYMVLNSEQHIGRFSFEQSFRSERIVHVDEYELKPGERELGSSLFASTLVVVSDWLGLGITKDAERIQLRLVGA